MVPFIGVIGQVAADILCGRDDIVPTAVLIHNVFKKSRRERGFSGIITPIKIGLIFIRLFSIS